MPQAMGPVLPPLRTPVSLAGDRWVAKQAAARGIDGSSRGGTQAHLFRPESPKVVPSRGAHAARLACTRGVDASALTLARDPSYTDDEGG